MNLGKEMSKGMKMVQKKGHLYYNVCNKSELKNVTNQTMSVIIYLLSVDSILEKQKKEKRIILLNIQRFLALFGGILNYY